MAIIDTEGVWKEDKTVRQNDVWLSSFLSDLVLLPCFHEMSIFMNLLYFY